MPSLSYNQRSRNIRNAADKEAKKLQALEVEGIHFLLAAALEKGSVAEHALERMGLSYELLLQEVKRLNRAKGNDSTKLALSAEASMIYDFAADIAKSMGNHFIGTEHVLLALVGELHSDAAKILGDKGFPYKRVQELVNSIIETKAN